MRDWKFHCAVLGVRETASAKEVRRAYRRLALERHPDKHNNSTKAKEDFQQLNESYRYLIDHIAEGLRTCVPPSQSQSQSSQQHHEERASHHNNSHQHSQQQQHHQQQTPRHSTPARLTPRPMSPKKIWAVSVAAAVLLLALSVGLDLLQAPPTEQRRDTRDLSLHANCQITDKISYTTETECYDRCRASAAGTACKWSGVVISDAPTPAPSNTGPNPLDVVNARAKEASKADRVSCKVSLDHGGGRTQDYHADSEPRCRQLCDQLRDMNPRAGIQCALAGEKPFFTRDLVVAKPEAPWTPPVPGPAPASLSASDMASICYISVVVPGSQSALPHPNETDDSCFNLCLASIKSNPHAAVMCDFAGHRIKTHIPDAGLVYAEEHPEAVAEAMGQFSPLRACKVMGTMPGGQTEELVGKLTEYVECTKECSYFQRTMPQDGAVSCSFDGRKL